jgi:carboxyl-terminal processing protease
MVQRQAAPDSLHEVIMSCLWIPGRPLFGAALLIALLPLGGIMSPARGEDDRAGVPATSTSPPASDEAQQEADEDYRQLQAFADALDQVERNYVRPVSRRELLESAIEGVLSQLDDYSDYYAPDDWVTFRQSVDAEYGGIGIQVAPDPDTGLLRVVSPILGSPAYRAGIAAGDLIRRIDGRDIQDMRLEKAVGLMKGKIGTLLKLTVIHSPDGEEEEIAVQRDVVQLETVIGYRRRPDHTWDYFCDHQQKIGYIQLTAFGPRTAEQLRGVLKLLTEAELEALVLDLRFNPGGLLSSAVEVADLFLAQGLIVKTQGRNVQHQEWHAEMDGTFGGFPMAALVNRYSASASEIVAASLQDHHRAIVVGERTWGKGNVQNVIELQGGRSGLKLTTASYYRPSGENIHRFKGDDDQDEWGVRPSEGMEVELSPRQIRELQQWRGLQMIVPSADASKSEQESPPEDPQLKRAIDALFRGPAVE